MPQYGPGGGYGWPEQPPQSLQDYYASIEQGSNRRFDLTLGESRANRQADLKYKMAAVDMQYKIAKLNAQTEAEKLAVDRWYKEQQTRIADETLKENVRQFDKQYGLNEADLTGYYGGNPTFARDKWQADATGYVGGRETLEREELRRRFGLDERTMEGRLGIDRDKLKLEAQRLGIDEAELLRRYGLDERRFGLDERRYGLEERDSDRRYGLDERRVGLDERETDRRYGLDERRFGADEADRLRRFGLDEGGLTGMYGGRQTLEAQELARRFGLDETELARRFGLDETELARRFGLDQQKFGLNVAQTAAEMRSRPDMLFQYKQFAQNLPGLLAGQGGQAPAPGTAPEGQTIQGQLNEVGYLQPVVPQQPYPQQPYAQQPYPQQPYPQQPYAQPGAPQPAAPQAGAQSAPTAQAPLSPQEQARYQQIMARRAELAAAGQGDVSPQDLAELQGYQARSGPGTPAPAASPYAGGIPNMGSAPGSYMQLQSGGSAYGGAGITDPRWRPGNRRAGGGIGITDPGWQPGNRQAAGDRIGISDPGWQPGNRGAAGGIGITDPGWQPGNRQAAGDRIGITDPGWQPGNRQAAGDRIGISDPGWRAPARRVAGGGTPASMAYLSNAAPDLSSDPTLQSLGKMYQSGFRKLGAQTLEGMDANELGFLKSAGTYQGYDPDREMRSYQRSRLGQ
ncbi:MAG TPA: hypothetical protein VIL10_05390 [Marmoricola sp.]